MAFTCLVGLVCMIQDLWKCNSAREWFVGVGRESNSTISPALTGRLDLDGLDAFYEFCGQWWHWNEWWPWNDGSTFPFGFGFWLIAVFSRPLQNKTIRGQVTVNPMHPTSSEASTFSISKIALEQAMLHHQRVISINIRSMIIEFQFQTQSNCNYSISIYTTFFPIAALKYTCSAD